MMIRVLTFALLFPAWALAAYDRTVVGVSPGVAEQFEKRSGAHVESRRRELQNPRYFVVGSQPDPRGCSYWQISEYEDELQMRPREFAEQIAMDQSRCEYLIQVGIPAPTKLEPLKLVARFVETTFGGTFGGIYVFFLAPWIAVVAHNAMIQNRRRERKSPRTITILLIGAPVGLVVGGYLLLLAREGGILLIIGALGFVIFLSGLLAALALLGVPAREGVERWQQ